MNGEQNGPREIALPGTTPTPETKATTFNKTAERVWLRLATAADLVDLTPAALRKRLARHAPPAGVVKRWGGSYFVHRGRFLRWLDHGE